MGYSAGIIGFGSFGQLAFRALTPFVSLFIYDPYLDSKDAITPGAKFSTLNETCSCEIVIVAVPVQSFQAVLQDIGPLLKPGTTVIDVCSVKKLPMLWMENTLPSHVDFMGTHPLFGPQSGKNGIQGLNIVVCRGNARLYERICHFLQFRLGLQVLERSPDAHDRQMAYVQGLTHLIGRAVNEMDIPDVEQKTPAYQFMLDIKRNLGQDSWQLFLAIEQLNPYAKEVREQFLLELQKLHNQLR